MGSLLLLHVGERILAMNVQSLDNNFVRLDILKYIGVLAYTEER